MASASLQPYRYAVGKGALYTPAISGPIPDENRGPEVVIVAAASVRP
ncbi:Uncharacterised protein [Mycobacteroides abscessus subsp. abscessus]|nr:Uncharacterised protein [Mycobacteroides abscessus subsp. abscessus]SKV77477.1 Uncharacterised protein [Mycobacteroides abscessus subsp. abscessus]